MAAIGFRSRSSKTPTNAPSDIKAKVRKYRAKNRRRAIIMASVLVVIAILAIFSASISTLTITFEQAFEIVRKAIFGIPYDNYMERLRATVIFDRCMPRTVAAICIGASLAVGGALMQSITRNSLADPYTIGISSAAMLGVTIGIIYNICVIPIFDGNVGTMVNAFLFALIPSAAIIAVSTFKKLSSTMMILIGIGIMYVFSAITTFLKFNASSENLQMIYEKGVGTLSDIVGMETTWPMIFGSAMIIVVGPILANHLNVMAAGDTMATALGVRPIVVRIATFLVISVSTGICVSFSGTIGFVGLVAPHVARLIVGSDNKILVPSSAIIGALLILGSDVLVRLIPGGLPVGVITALIGSPIFILILYRQRKNAAF